MKIKILHLLLFITYLVLFCWLIAKLRLYKTNQLTSTQLILLFIAKAACGVFYGYFLSKNIANADTWQIYNTSVVNTKMLFSDPLKFFISWVYDPSYDYQHPFSAGNSYWNDIRDVMMIKAEAFLNIFSFSNYYINVLFYAFLTFSGYIAFMKAYTLLFPDANKMLLVMAAFFIPSTFFWTSGMHKDGTIFMLISFIIYQCTLWLVSGKPLRKVLFKILVCFFFIFLLRNYVALSLAFVLAVCVLSCKYPKQSTKLVTTFLALGIGCFFLSSHISPALSLPEWLVKRRISFNELAANSKLSYNTLDSSAYSYLANLPEALNHGFLRPYLWENMGVFYIPFALEIVVIIILTVFYLFNHQQLTSTQKAFLLFGALFLFINWLFLGYVVHIVGALVRYRSIFLPFFVAPMLLSAKFRPLIKN